MLLEDDHELNEVLDTADDQDDEVVLSVDELLLHDEHEHHDNDVHDDALAAIVHIFDQDDEVVEQVELDEMLVDENEDVDDHEEQ